MLEEKKMPKLACVLNDLSNLGSFGQGKNQIVTGTVVIFRYSGKLCLKLECPLPTSILTIEEEAKLVEWAVHMSEIGYGRTKKIVKQIIEKDGCSYPFSDNRPGKKWWKQRHPEISLRKHLQLARAKCCTYVYGNGSSLLGIFIAA